MGWFACIEELLQNVRSKCRFNIIFMHITCEPLYFCAKFMLVFECLSNIFVELDS